MTCVIFPVADMGLVPFSSCVQQQPTQTPARRARRLSQGAPKAGRRIVYFLHEVARRRLRGFLLGGPKCSSGGAPIKHAENATTMARRARTLRAIAIALDTSDKKTLSWYSHQ